MNKKNKIKEIVEEIDNNILFLEDIFDDALIGTGRTCGGKEVATYDIDKCLLILINLQNMDETEAIEKFQDTVDNSVSGEYKPIFINDFRNIKEISLEKIDDLNKSLNDFMN